MEEAERINDCGNEHYDGTREGVGGGKRNQSHVHHEDYEANLQNKKWKGGSTEKYSIN